MNRIRNPQPAIQFEAAPEGVTKKMYPELMVIPMREELTRAGINEARTAEDVDNALKQPGTTMVVVNSICGCAAGKMRPGVRLALQHATKPDPGDHRLRRSGPRRHRARTQLLPGSPAHLTRCSHSPRRPVGLPDAALCHRDLHRPCHRPGTHPRLRRLLRDLGGLSARVQIHQRGGLPSTPQTFSTTFSQALRLCADGTPV